MWRMRFAYWITKATDTHSEYVIIVFSLQRLRVVASLLSYTYVVCLTSFVFELRTITVPGILGDEGGTIFRNVGNYLAIDAASQLRRLGSSIVN
jgi:hypothetical protein